MRHGDFAPFIRSAIASLKAGLPAAIATYNGEAENTYDLDVPDVADFWFGGNDALTVFPAVEVSVPTGTESNFAIGQEDADASPHLVVAIWIEGETGDVPEIYEKALGYGRVAGEVLTKPDAFGPQVVIKEGSEVRFTFPTVPVGPSYNAEARRFDKWRTAAVIEVDLDDEARG